ncbi:hypothetical protein AKO1_015856 [Acrasis kona]|uniref:Protein kinase domain-containing protein n=1 Tax=Acrasis kona TaxID=1008807 RepID=A0AAW2ZH96_9EUKA
MRLVSNMRRQCYGRYRRGGKNSDQGLVTIFSFDITKDVAPEKLELARNTFKRMRAIRHPNMVPYLDGVELPNVLYIVTEYVTPVLEYLRSNGSSGPSNLQDAVSWGIYSVAQGLIFLHSKHLYHGNISSQSIYVDEAGEWKIGELGFLSEVLDPNAVAQEGAVNEQGTYGFPIRKLYGYLSHKYKAPEVNSQRWDVVAQFPDRVDSFGLGCLVFEVFEGPIERPQDLKRSPHRMPKKLVSSYNHLIQDNPAQRIPLPNFIAVPFFNNNMVETCLFLDNLSLKDPVSIETFLTGLPDQLDSLPVNTCKRKILPVLVNAIKFGSGGSKAIHAIFKISTMMNETEFKAEFIPKILELFESNDRTVRVSLLKNLNTIMPHLTNQQVEEKVYANVAKGFKDSAPALREMTVKSMIDIAPKLSANVLNDDLIRNLWNLQADKEASIRTNSVIAIGKLAPALDDKTRKKVLLAAFTRSLRDPFVHSRISALKALSATKEYYTTRDIATKLLPSVISVAVDPERSVRDLAIDCVSDFMNGLSAVCKSDRFDQIVSQEDGVQIGQEKSASGQPGAAAAGGQQGGDGGYYNWAVSGLSSGVNVLKNKVVGDGAGGSPAVVENHIGTMGGQYKPPPPRNTSSTANVSTPKGSTASEWEPPVVKKSNVMDDETVPNTRNTFYDDDDDVFGSSGSAWESLDATTPKVTTLRMSGGVPATLDTTNKKIGTTGSSAFANLNKPTVPTTSNNHALVTKKKQPAKSDNPFDDDMSAWDTPPIQPTTAPSSSLQLKKPISPVGGGLRTEHRPQQQGFSMNTNPTTSFNNNNNNNMLQPKKAIDTNNGILQPKKSTAVPLQPKKASTKSSSKKDDLEIDWDAF